MMAGNSAIKAAKVYCEAARLLNSRYDFASAGTYRQRGDLKKSGIRQRKVSWGIHP
jgi:hypothetical protein